MSEELTKEVDSRQPKEYLSQLHPVYHKDMIFYRIVIITLSIIAVICVVIGGSLAFCDKNVPDFIISIGSAAVGALAGVISSTGK